MSEVKQCDWIALKVYLESISHLTTATVVPSTPDLEHFARLQRFIGTNQHVADPVKSRDAMIDLASDLQLSWRRAARLFIELQKLSSMYRLGRHYESQERAGDAVKDLEKIRKALSILTKFSKRALAEDAEPRMRIAEKKIENAAHLWAAALRQDSEKSGHYKQWELAKGHGFFHTQNQDDSGKVSHSYDAFSVVRTWLRNNVLFSELVRVAIEDEYTRREHDTADPAPERYIETLEMGEAVRLAGEKLPKLYERFTGNSFTWKTSGDAVTDEGGVKFVRVAMRVMGLEPVGVETVVKHVKKIRSRSAASAG